MNIDGVRVLAQEAISETPNWVSTVAYVLISCTIITMIITVISLKNWAIIGCFVMSIITFAWIIIIGGIGVFDKPSDRNTYKCFFEEDVSIQEVYDKYEVVGRDGEIWILEDKE